MQKNRWYMFDIKMILLLEGALQGSCIIVITYVLALAFANSNKCILVYRAPAVISFGWGLLLNRYLKRCLLKSFVLCSMDFLQIAGSLGDSSQSNSQLSPPNRRPVSILAQNRNNPGRWGQFKFQSAALRRIGSSRPAAWFYGNCVQQATCSNWNP